MGFDCLLQGLRLCTSMQIQEMFFFSVGFALAHLQGSPSPRNAWLSQCMPHSIESFLFLYLGGPEMLRL